MQCLQVRELKYDDKGLKVGTPGAFGNFYDRIEGYSHEPGIRNVLRVDRYTIKNPTADASKYAYVLDLVVESANEGHCAAGLAFMQTSVYLSQSACRAWVGTVFLQHLRRVSASPSRPCFAHSARASIDFWWSRSTAPAGIDRIRPKAADNRMQRDDLRMRGSGFGW